MRNISPRKYAISLYESLCDIQKNEISAVIKSFVSLLVRNKDISKADKIVKAFRKFYCEKENILEVSVTTAGLLDDDIKAMVIKQLNGSLNKEIELQATTDKSTIGGIILKYDDTVVDGSVKRRIELLADSLK
jgi:F-type H+-transporting ATPase subunit delta